MKQIIESLSQIEKSAKSGDAAKIEMLIQAARKAASGAKEGPLKQLDEELSTWQKKLSTILKEPVGRQGMAKHARHWIEQLESGQ